MRVLEALPREAFTAWVASTPTGVAHRRAWFWREHLLGDRLKLPNAPKVQALPL